MSAPSQNLLFGVISTASDPIPRCAAAIQDVVVELGKYWKLKLDHAKSVAPEIDLGELFSRATLNGFAEQPSSLRFAVRQHLSDTFARGSVPISCLVPLKDVVTHVPMSVENYVDFYTSLEHAKNCATLVGGDVGANFYSSPLCYNGRATSIVSSSIDIERPKGMSFQEGTSEIAEAYYAPTKKLDYELEVGYFISKSLARGQTLAIKDAPEYIFGFVLLNDWSSRDIQAFEMHPLGPFHSKGFGTTISSWVVPLDLLLPHACPTKHQQASTTPHHLRWEDISSATFPVHLKTTIIRNSELYGVSLSNLRDLYWTPYQQLTHLASGGCGMASGDLIGTGTISGETPGTRGCLFEATEDGTKPIALRDGQVLTYLEDGDEVVMEGWCAGDNGEQVLSFGECRGRVIPTVWKHGETDH